MTGNPQLGSDNLHAFDSSCPSSSIMQDPTDDGEFTTPELAMDRGEVHSAYSSQTSNICRCKVPSAGPDGTDFCCGCGGFGMWSDSSPQLLLDGHGKFVCRCRDPASGGADRSYCARCGGAGAWSPMFDLYLRLPVAQSIPPQRTVPQTHGPPGVGMPPP